MKKTFIYICLIGRVTRTFSCLLEIQQCYDNDAYYLSGKRQSVITNFSIKVIAFEMKRVVISASLCCVIERYVWMQFEVCND